MSSFPFHFCLNSNSYHEETGGQEEWLCSESSRWRWQGRKVSQEAAAFICSVVAGNLQARVQVQVQAQSQIEKGKRNLDSGLFLKSQVLRVFVIVSSPVANSESSSVHRRSPKSINQSPNSKFLGLSLSTGVWFESREARWWVAADPGPSWFRESRGKLREIASGEGDSGHIFVTQYRQAS